MKEVYSAASRVLVWLGPEADDGHLALDLIRAWAGWGKSAKDVTTEMTEVLMDTIKKMPEPFEQRSWLAARRFFARPYWKRTWIFQEIVFARQIIILCGRNQLSWDELGRAQIAWVQLSSPRLTTVVNSEALRLVTLTHYSTVSALAMRHALQQDDRRAESIPALISLISTHLAKDPRDKVYALLGFPEVDMLDVSPNYSAPIEFVYTDFVQRCLEFEGDLRILTLAGIGWHNGDARLNLPTWVSDFRPEGLGQHPRMQSKHFDAAGTSKGDFEVSDDMKVLRAKGIIFDVITSITPYYSRKSAIPGHLLNVALSEKSAYPTGIPRLQAFFRTIIADDFDEKLVRTQPPHTRGQVEFFDLAAGFLWCLGDYAVRENETNSNRRQLDDQRIDHILKMNDYVWYFGLWSGHFPDSLTKEAMLAPFLGDPDSEYPALQWPEDNDLRRGRNCSSEFMERSIHSCISRTFFLTEKGYMGLGPRRAKKGDILCVLPGCNVPLLLRRIDNHYVLVGYGYVLGLMMGELFKESRSETPEMEEIIIH